MTPTHDELVILRAILQSYHPKARTKPRNFIRTFDTPENLATFDAMVTKGWLTKDEVPGHVYRATPAGKAIFQEHR